MCDYSLHNVAQRDARIGDKLITTVFRNTSTRGLAAVDDQRMAVCLRPGTELCFDDPGKTPRWYHAFSFAKRAKLGERATFRQINLDKSQAHHDAVEFEDGRVVLVTYLAEGQRVSVLQLPVDQEWAPGEEVGRSIEHAMLATT